MQSAIRKITYNLKKDHDATNIWRRLVTDEIYCTDDEERRRVADELREVLHRKRRNKTR